MKYDYLIVGAGLFGSIVAYELTKKGYRCLVIEKRDHIGGNCYTENIEGINVHKYGAHIFHTNDKKIWDYINSFVEFNRYTNTPIAINDGKVYNLPFNMNTFHAIWGVNTPKEAKEKILQQTEKYASLDPQNLEEQALKLVGEDIYNLLIKDYTEKQWGKSAKELPSFIIKRLPLRFTYDNNYFNDKYQGIPIGGYTKIFEKLLENIDLKLNTDFFEKREYFEKISDNIIYTGPIDLFFNYNKGKLEYRSLRFENEILDTDNFQGNAVVNYTSLEQPYTRIIEHKHFEFGTQEKTYITKEYPDTWDENKEPYYPINDDKNMEIYTKYKKQADELPHIIFGGRMAEYRYYDMHQIIGSALSKVEKIPPKNR
ncbi:UDP-galactopyranose mutase [Riemerella anatipestifer]|nr:UDP-galactopyranose mutase [Riemerella anatipestifer]